MEQLPAKFINFEGEVQKLASVLGLYELDIDANLPIVYGSTCIYTLLVPIKTLDASKKCYQIQMIATGYYVELLL